MNICTVDDCERPVHGAGYCRMHWDRWRTHGDPLVYATAASGEARIIDAAVIALSRDMVAVVDTSDLSVVEPYTWCAIIQGGLPYALHDDYRGRFYMHRLLLGVDGDILVDHKNGNTLDNRRSNLRICTKAQNMANARLRVTNTSGFKGVCQLKSKSKRWAARIMVNGKNLHLGTFATPEDAARAYDAGARKHFGEFAYGNFDENGERQ